jgi:hypothetical protein
VCSVIVAVEGDTDLPVARALLREAGLAATTEIDSGGKSRLDSRLPGYNAAARSVGWFVLRDLDHDADCPPALLRKLVGTVRPLMCLRIPVRALESWLMADGEMLARFLRVSRTAVPSFPDELPNPKLALVALARKSTKPGIRRAMVPPPQTNRPVGPEYEARLIEFGTHYWRLHAARKRSPSLESSIEALRRLRRRLGALG